MDSYYDQLGVRPDASTETIKTAYRQLARRFHPDVDPNPTAAARFKQISEAYATLRDARQRLRYNQTLLTADPIVQPSLKRRELWAAWERVGAYAITGGLISAGCLILAYWIGSTSQSWLLTALVSVTGLGAGLGLLWGIDANFVVGDFVTPMTLWLIRLVRLVSWVGGLILVARLLVNAVNFNPGLFTATLTQNAMIGAAIVGLLIGVIAALRDH